MENKKFRHIMAYHRQNNRGNREKLQKNVISQNADMRILRII